VKAVIELASLEVFNETHIDFLEQVTESIGIVLNTIEANTRTEELLTQSQSMGSELKIQQNELRRTNDELQDKALLLVKQKEEVEAKNKEVEEARKSLEEKAEQLTLTSKYKSEFLANMSHELRTPLNSLLILAQQLYENAEGNLNEKQIRYAKTIHSCGDDLIQLINDILDLSKIESGFISTNISSVPIAEIASFVETTFKPISEARNLKFRIEMDQSLPSTMETDIQRLNQILKNLLSNAFKFTEKGEVTLRIVDSPRKWKPGNQNLDRAKKVIGFSISDTGIGIPLEKQMIIFEAFQQAEGSTSRKYGGTGLGLSISRGLAELLGGTIELESSPGIGSVFTLFIPIDSVPNIATRETSKNIKAIEQLQLTDNNGDIDTLLNTLRVTKDGVEARMEIVNEMINETGDDRTHIQPSDKVVLIVEDDFRFGKIVIEKAHEAGLKAIVATNYLEVFDFINRFSPIAITLDVKLPDTSGWKVLELLRNDLNYRHIPIHVISGEENKALALKRGARSFLLKPLDNAQLDDLLKDIVSNQQREAKKILVVEDNEIDSSQIAKVIGDTNLLIMIATTGAEAIDLIQREDPDCIILDYTLPDISGPELIHQISQAKKRLTPVIVYSAKDFSKVELNQVIQNSNSIIAKSANSIEQLLEETIVHLHINHKELSREKRRIIENIRSKEDILSGKNILVVDDDVRNLFALTTVFERYNINVITAESGKDAIQILNDNPKVDMVLMDIMMPEMDGYETTQKIRREHKNSSLPIIAVTAKAMKGDRQKCIEAGASDYITKPVKIDQLLSLMRLWFCK
jgi:signal transduction histidine kinase/CheY-like chemotaxis protein